MSKHVDLTKIERIRESAIRSISRSGQGKASVASIAADAGVSMGYLYRHYPGKEALLNDLLGQIMNRLSDRIEALISERSKPAEVVEEFVRYLFETAAERPDHIRFCLNLQNDFSCDISDSVTTRLRALCEDLYRKGVSSGSFGSNVRPEDLYVNLICLPLQYIGIRFRGVFQPFAICEKEIKKISAVCMAALNA